MEAQESILKEIVVDSSGAEQLKTAGRWARFIGIFFISMGSLVLLSSLFLFFSIDYFQEDLMQLNGMSESSFEFLSSYGKWILLLMMLIVVGVIVFNAYSLIKFSQNNNHFWHTRKEMHLSNSFYHLNNYLKITVILGIISVIISLASSILSLSFN